MEPAGTTLGNLAAYDARTLEEVWSVEQHAPFLLGTAVQGSPITYMLDGVQYLAVPATVVGGSPWVVSTLLAPEIHIPPGERHNAMYVFRVGQR